MGRVISKTKDSIIAVLFRESFQEPSLFQLFTEPQGHSVWKGRNRTFDSRDIFIETFRQEAGHQGDLGEAAEQCEDDLPPWKYSST